MLLRNALQTGLKSKYIRETMTSDLDIYRSANVLIREHGEDAELEAAKHADAMLEKGDLEGLAVWKRIGHQRSRPADRAVIRRDC